MTKIGTLIKTRRTERKLTQQDVADKVGISRNFLSDIENGRYNPSFNTALRLAAYLGIDLNSLSEMTEIQGLSDERRL